MSRSMLLRCLILLSFTLFFYAGTAQQIPRRVLSSKRAADGRINFLKFELLQQRGPSDTAANNVRRLLGLGSKHALVHDIRAKAHQGLIRNEQSFSRLKQYFNGIRVEYGMVNVHARNGLLSVISGDYFPLEENFSVTPLIPENTALAMALSFVGARKYSWEDPNFYLEEIGKEKPKGELVICRDFTVDRNAGVIMRLAYKFAIYAVDPLRYDYIYVDAANGRIIHVNKIIKHIDGVAETRYSGSRTLATTQVAGGNFVLRDSSSSYNIATYNLNRGTNYNAATEFSDNDNNWTAGEHNNANFDNAALDAHWGTMMTIDYWRTVHNRNSFDNLGGKIKTYVHYGNLYSNAFWNGTVMTYGDGNGSTIFPLTTVDICSHEIGHAICQYTANLIYSDEPGALNESFSDIWGACVKRFAAPEKNTWMCGDEISNTGNPIRSLSNPKSKGHPDTYKGVFWYDGADVHINSSVMNHWFYILTEGKAGTNDKGTTYSVSGIGITKAASIAYRAESVYLFPSARYADARIFTIQAAEDLYGANSNEVIQTAAAWDAVGVYQVIAIPTALTGNFSWDRIILNWTIPGNSSATGFLIERAIDASPYTQIGIVDASTRTFTDNGYGNNSINKYRIRSYKDSAYSEYSDELSIPVGNAPYPMQTGNLATCGITFLDPGGFGLYPNGTNITTTISPAIPGHKVRLTFSMFRTESSYDYLRVYNGPSTSSPNVGQFSGTILPPMLESTAANGELTLQFSSNSWIADSGWRAQVSCFKPVAAPTNLTATADSSGRVGLQWTDNADDETHYVIERSLNDSLNFSRLANVALNVTTFTDTSAPNHSLIFYRIRAFRDTIHSKYSNTASVTTGKDIFIMQNMNLTTCGVTFLDPGGFGNYPSLAASVTTTVTPAVAGNKVRISFSMFRMEYSADNLRVYNGPSTNSPLLGEYSGLTLPPVLESTAPNGELTFRFYSSTYISDSGWVAYLSCIKPVARPSVLTAVADTLQKARLTWVDNADDETIYIVERSVNAPLKYSFLAQLPANTTSYYDSTAPANSMVYYRVKAIRDSISSLFSDTVRVSLGNSPLLVATGTVFTCDKVFMDHGGVDVMPAGSMNTVTTIKPSIPGNRVRVTFTHFKVSGNLSVFNGSSTSSPLLGYYYGSTLPPVLEGANADGSLTFSFSSYGYRDSGWIAYVTCYKPVAKPTGLLLTLDSAQKVHLTWSDNADDETKYVVERSLNAPSKYTLLAELPANAVSYHDTTAPLNSLAYYRVRAFRDTVGSFFSDAANVPVGDAPFLMSPGTFTICNKVFMDPGGVDIYASQPNQTTTTIKPSIAGTRVRVRFSKFRISGYLTVYNGSSVSSPYLGSYGGSSLPPFLDGTGPDGSLSFVFSTNSWQDSGWVAYVGCYQPVEGPTTLTAFVDSAKHVRLLWNDNSSDETGFVIERSPDDSLHFSVLYQTGATTTQFIDSAAPDNSLVYYKVRAIRDSISSKYSNTVEAPIGNPPVFMTSGTVSTCDVKFYDPGGPNRYQNGLNYTMTFSPAIAGSKLKVAFTQFRTEGCCDYLKIYNGPSTSSPLLGNFYGYTLPPTLESSAPNGELTFHFTSDGSVVDSGWIARITCSVPLAAPSLQVPLTQKPTVTKLQWTDPNSNETGIRVERSDMNASDFKPLALLPANTTSYIDSNAVSNVTMYYRVQAINGAVQSLFSDTQSVQTQNCGPAYTLADGSATGLIYLSTVTTLVSDSCEVYGEINPHIAPIGIVSTRLRTEDRSITDRGRYFVKRHFDFTPKTYSSTSTRQRLFFTQEEFNDYNSRTAHAKLPSGPDDTAAFGNFQVLNYRGTSYDSSGRPATYGTLPLEVDSAEILWNTTYNCWEVRAAPGGFGGMFLSSRDDTTRICSDTAGGPGTTSFKSNIYHGQYRWQKFDGTTFVNITDDSSHMGSLTYLLHVKNSSINNGDRYRCVAGGIYSREFVVAKGNWWNGNASSDWNNPLNWSCGSVPEMTSDVVIPGGKTNYPTIQSNTLIRSLTVQTGATLRVTSGANVTTLK